jgi:hypothetical protein
MNDILIKTRRRFLCATLGVAFFAAVYELFSHQVYSDFLLFAFLFPLLGGVLPCTILLRSPRLPRPGVLTRCLYPSGLATLTAGSLFQGILEIYGTTNRLSSLYWAAGSVLLALGLISFLAETIFASRGRPRTFKDR